VAQAFPSAIPVRLVLADEANPQLTAYLDAVAPQAAAVGA
jgi:hypothetical protein